MSQGVGRGEKTKDQSPAYKSPYFPPSRGMKGVAASPVGAVLFIKRYEWRFLLLIGLCMGIVGCCCCWTSRSTSVPPLVPPAKSGSSEHVSLNDDHPSTPAAKILRHCDVSFSRARSSPATTMRRQDRPKDSIRFSGI